MAAPPAAPAMPNGGEHQRAGPFHVARAHMAGEAERRARRHRDGAGADRGMGRGYAYHIEQERHGEDRAAAADQAERDTDQRAGGDRENRLQLDHGRAPRSVSASGRGHAPVPRHHGEQLRHAAEAGHAGEHEARADEAGKREEARVHQHAEHYAEHNQRSRADLDLALDVDRLAAVERHRQARPCARLRGRPPP